MIAGIWVFALSLATLTVAKDWESEYNTIDYQRFASTLDTNGDHMLDMEELRQIPVQLLNGRDVAQLLDTYDVNGDGVLSFDEFTAAGHILSVHPLSSQAESTDGHDVSLLDTASLAEHRHKQRAEALSRMRTSNTASQQALSRVLVPKGDCCYRDEVAINNRCYPPCKDSEHAVSVGTKVYCTDKDCPSQSTCKTSVSNGICSDVCIHCTKTCPSQKCPKAFCSANGQYGCWYQPPNSDENAQYLCDTGNVLNGVYYEQPIEQRLNLPSGDPHPCSDVYWNDDTLKPRNA